MSPATTKKARTMTDRTPRPEFAYDFGRLARQDGSFTLQQAIRHGEALGYDPANVKTGWTKEDERKAFLKAKGLKDGHPAGYKVTVGRDALGRLLAAYDRLESLAETVACYCDGPEGEDAPMGGHEDRTEGHRADPDARATVGACLDDSRPLADARLYGKAWRKATAGLYLYQVTDARAAADLAKQHGGQAYTEHSDDEGPGVNYAPGVGGFVNVLGYMVALPKPLPADVEGKAPGYPSQVFQPKALKGGEGYHYLVTVGPDSYTVTAPGPSAAKRQVAAHLKLRALPKGATVARTEA